jgi:hypothetical protein
LPPWKFHENCVFSEEKQECPEILRSKHKACISSWKVLRNINKPKHQPLLVAWQRKIQQLATQPVNFG